MTECRQIEVERPRKEHVLKIENGALANARDKHHISEQKGALHQRSSHQKTDHQNERIEGGREKGKTMDSRLEPLGKGHLFFGGLQLEVELHFFHVVLATDLFTFRRGWWNELTHFLMDFFDPLPRIHHLLVHPLMQ